MLIVDTNVVAELMRPAPDEGVAHWLDRRPLGDLAITAVTVGEILYGLDLLPDGRRKADLASRFGMVLKRAFSGCVLPFDDAAAILCAKIRGDRRRTGRPVSINDAMIAAIARSQGAMVVTRNIDDFEGCGIVLVNPWDEDRSR
jgi:predicted nucleic acid-binding protein